MSDFSKPVITDSYTAVLSEIRDNFDDVAQLGRENTFTEDQIIEKTTATLKLSDGGGNYAGIYESGSGELRLLTSRTPGDSGLRMNGYRVVNSAAGTTSGELVEYDQLTGHTHTGSGDEGPQLAQGDTHQSPDTDTATNALHHTLGTGANQAAAGNHTHSYSSVTLDGGGGNSGSASAATSLEIAVNLTNIASTSAQPYVNIPFFASATEGTDCYTLSGVVTIPAGSNDVRITGNSTNPEDAANSTGYLVASLSGQRGSTSYAYATLASAYGTIRSIRIGYKKGASDNQGYLVIDDSGTTTWDTLVLMTDGFSLKVA